MPVHLVAGEMMNFGVPIPPDRIDLIGGYFARRLPRRAAPGANPLPVLVAAW